MNRRILLLTLLTGLMVTFGASFSAHAQQATGSAQAASQAAIDNTGPLRVAMFTGFEPMVFTVSGQIQGIEVDFAALVAASLGRPLEVRTYRFPELIGALEAGEVDVIMSGFSVTEERKTRVRFAAPYMDIGQMAIVRVADARRLGGPKALNAPGLKIGVHQGSTGEDYVRTTFRDAQIIAYGGVESGLAGLREKEVDVFIHDSTTSWQLGRSFVNDNLISLNQNLTRESIAWAVHADNAELQAQLTRLVEVFREKGKIAEVLARWIPVIPTPAD